MNLKSTVLIGILTLGIGFSGMKPVDANSLSVKPFLGRDSTLISQPSSFTVAQLTEANSPIYGTWKLQYSANGIVHESILRMQGYTGSMRTRYFNAETRRTDTVEQTMRLKSSASGLILLGSNPVYARSSIRHPSYSPDNFLFQISPEGTLVVFTCDNELRCSSVDLEVIR